MKQSITVITLGPGSAGKLTLETFDLLKDVKRKLVLRTARHPMADWLREQQISFEDLDAFYDQYEDFDEMHRQMASSLWKRAAEESLTLAVADAAFDACVQELCAQRPVNASLDILPGVSLASNCLAQLPEIPGTRGIRVLPAYECVSAQADPSVPLLITEIDNRILAGEVKLWLTDVYDDMQDVAFFPGCADGKQHPIKKICLCELDRQKHFDHTVCLYLPPVPFRLRTRYTFADLLQIMDILRAPGGCPWDREQTHTSIRQNLLEEAYEVCGAIDEDDPDHLADELGDLLLHVVFHANIGKDCGEFTISDVTTAICKKMIFRHAHVFGNRACNSLADEAQLWEQQKKQEKGLETLGDVLSDVSVALPALTRAAKVQRKAGNGGFHWETAEDIPAMLERDIQLFNEETSTDRDLTERMGELLFSVVSLAGKAGTDPELALEKATNAFVQRVSRMENCVKSDRKSLEDLTLSEMHVYWNMVKRSL